MRSAEADGINVDEHFNLMVEMVGVGSGARRSVENYHLTREACIFIARQVYAKKKEVQAALEYFSSVSIDFDGAECDVNCQEVVSEMEKDKIRERNREHWKRLNDEASEFYKKKMRLLDEVEDFKADASFHGNKAPHHMMYKLGTLYSKDGCRGYEFLIEYDVYEPVVGIYYGCKGLILDGNDEDGEKCSMKNGKIFVIMLLLFLKIHFRGNLSLIALSLQIMRTTILIGPFGLLFMKMRILWRWVQGRFVL